MSNFFDLLLKRNLYFSIPETEPVSRQQFALFRIFSFVGTVVCAGVSAKMLMTISNAGPLPFFVIALGFIMLMNFYTLRAVSHLRRSYFIMLVSAYLLLHVVSYSCGGIMTAGTFYFSAVILYAYMLLGRKAGKWFTVAVICHVIYLYIISTYTDLTSFDFFKGDVTLIKQDFLVNAIMTLLLIAAQGNYLQSGKNEVIQEVEKQRLQLQEKNEVLERKNELLNHYAHNLEKTNDELRKFASVASHDLKAPLRAIGSLAGFIEDEEAGRLKPESLQFINTLKQRVNRMDNLLNALLEYSNIIESAVGVEEIKTDELIYKIAVSLAKSTSIQIGFEGEFPVVNMNRNLLKKVFFNLMHNAVTFNDKPEKNILISVKAKNNNFYFTVNDNGPGIDEKFHEKIFVIFQTLNPRDEIETMGVGLPIVRKIVESWNGSVSVKSCLGEGTTFAFTVPASYAVKSEFKIVKSQFA